MVASRHRAGDDIAGGARLGGTDAEKLRRDAILLSLVVRVFILTPHLYVQELYKGLADGAEEEGSSVAVAGRVVNKRVMGKLAFLSMRDDKGQMQVGTGKGKRQLRNSCTWTAPGWKRSRLGALT